MPVVVAWIGRMLLSVAGRMVISGLVAAGIGLATGAAFSAIGMGDKIRAMLGSAGPLYGWVGFFGLDTAITIILSALAARAAVNAAKAYFVAAKPKGGA